MKPLISIVIPTRNRQKYCIAAIEDILSYDYPLLELCIQDNSDNNELEEYVAKRKYDSRFVYKRIPEQMASVFNIGGSLGLATGKYVIMIGDDDTILPDLFDVVEYMDKNDIESLSSKPILNYYWPGAHTLYADGALVIPSGINKQIPPQIINVENQIEKLFKKGIIRYSKYDLPKVYHGIVKLDYIKQIYNKLGLYCGGLSPDIYLVVSLSSMIKNHYKIEYPITMAGACNKSTSSAQSKDSQIGELKTMPHLNLRGEYTWDKLVPAYYTGDTIWAESALKAVSDMQIPKLRSLFNYNYFCAYTILYHRNISKLVRDKSIESIKESKNSKVSFFVGVSFYILTIATKQIIKEIRRKIVTSDNDYIITDNVKDINQASKQYQKIDK